MGRETFQREELSEVEVGELRLRGEKICKVQEKPQLV